jgi:Flp pilus assembly protein CpaB
MLARSPRALALWAGALAVAAGTATLVASDLAALHRRARSLGDERAAVVATRTLTLGDVVTGADVHIRRIHSSQLPRGVLRAVDEAVGRVVVVAALRGGFVADENLAPRRRAGLDGALPEGTRALRVVVRDTVRPRAGAAVDILASFESVGADGLPSSGDGRARLVAPGVLVLAAERVQTAEGDALGVTVLVSPRQARALAFASTHGRLDLALVPPEDAKRP